MCDNNKEAPKRVNLEEGTFKKGGVNPKPSTPRPAEPPKAQTPPDKKK